MVSAYDVSLTGNFDPQPSAMATIVPTQCYYHLHIVSNQLPIVVPKKRS
jgi:hypothetical protein